MARQVRVIGPAYLDRVVLVDRPLVDPTCGLPLDQSVEGCWKFGDGLTLHDPKGGTIAVTPPEGWPGPSGEVHLSRPLVEGPAPWRRAVRGISWHDDLGGMGAGYASALGGVLVHALGLEDEPTSRAVVDLLAHAGVAHRPIRVAGHPADWTLLLTSGPFGDKLPIGFRGCHAALASIATEASTPCDLRVVAALPNRLAAEALTAPGAAVRFFAPALRNMLDRDPPLSDFAESIDVLSCNRREWERLEGREHVGRCVALLVITDGPRGSTVRFTTPQGQLGQVQVAAFPRMHPPRDTNRAGETYAATLLTALLDGGWTPGAADARLVRAAALRASAAAALVLDRMTFGFPAPAEIEAALRAGCVY